MRELAPDLGRAFADAFSLATGAGPPFQPPCPHQQTGETLIVSIQANPGKSNDPGDPGVVACVDGPWIQEGK